MTLAPSAKQQAPREPNYLDLLRIEMCNARAADLDIALARCGNSQTMFSARKAIGSAIQSILAEMLRGEA